MSKEKSIYDNEKFFNSYMEIREGENNHNDLIEQPTVKRLLPDLKGKTVLELGCGYGENAIDFINRGAKRVTAIDLSSRMLNLAKQKSSHPCVDYYKMDMAEIDKLNGKFDLVYSSLAFHYVEDFKGLIKKISQKLKKGGTLLFSQEHPLTTATIDGKGIFNKSESGEYLSYTFSNYNQSGKRIVHWLVDGLVKYHRNFSEIINGIIDTGLTVTKVLEPCPGDETVASVPRMAKERIKPSFLIIKAEKK